MLLPPISAIVRMSSEQPGRKHQTIVRKTRNRSFYRRKSMSTQTYESVLPVVSYEDASPAGQRIFDQLKANIRRVPNLYAAQSYSPLGLSANLALGGELSKGVFNGLPKEVIALAVAQVNGCDYCLAV